MLVFELHFHGSEHQGKDSGLTYKFRVKVKLLVGCRVHIWILVLGLGFNVSVIFRDMVRVIWCE